MKITALTRFVVLVIALLLLQPRSWSSRRDEWVAVLNDEGDQARVTSSASAAVDHQPGDTVLSRGIGSCIRRNTQL